MASAVLAVIIGACAVLVLAFLYNRGYFDDCKKRLRRAAQKPDRRSPTEKELAIATAGIKSPVPPATPTSAPPLRLVQLHVNTAGSNFTPVSSGENTPLSPPALADVHASKQNDFVDASPVARPMVPSPTRSITPLSLSQELSCSGSDLGRQNSDSDVTLQRSPERSPGGSSPFRPSGDASPFTRPRSTPPSPPTLVLEAEAEKSPAGFALPPATHAATGGLSPIARRALEASLTQPNARPVDVSACADSDVCSDTIVGGSGRSDTHLDCDESRATKIYDTPRGAGGK